jgi:hypothetical protein
LFTSFFRTADIDRMPDGDCSTLDEAGPDGRFTGLVGSNEAGQISTA